MGNSFFGMCACIDQASIGVVERWGRFEKLAEPGINFFNPFAGEWLAGVLSTRINSLDVRIETKTKVFSDHRLNSCPVGLQTYIYTKNSRRLKLRAMASDPLDTLEQQNGGGHRCISPPLAPIIGGRDPESRMTASIQQRLDGVPPLYSECCIYRVPERLRKINEEAYRPHFVSIGPFHHGKENLKVQETLKWQQLRSFLGRNPGVKLSQYVKTIKEIEERIRNCYAEIISVNSDEFVTMMLVDGSFILEYIYRSAAEQGSITSPWFLVAIERDLILLENQLPFFVLEELYKLNIGNKLATLAPIIRLCSFLLASDMLSAEEEQVLKENRNWSQVAELFAFVNEGCSSPNGLPRDNINEEADPAVLLSTETSSVTVDIPAETSLKKHLLDFVRDCFIPSSSANNTSQLSSGNGNSEELERPGQDMITLTSAGEIRETDDDASRVLNCTSDLYPWNWSGFIPSSSAPNTSGNKELQYPQNVTALHKAGVKLEVGSADKCLLDISFENGVLAIPCIYIYDRTESLLRNMIAFEQLCDVGPPHARYITHYATLLDSLIDTSKDVELLHDHGIIKHSLGYHEEVSQLFNKLVTEVIINQDDNFYFYRLCQDLNAYHRYWHAWIADLRQTYFNTPWTAISVIAAAVLIVLTILQTIYTIKSYIKQ